MGTLVDLTDLYERAAELGYVLLPDDYTALGYAAMNVNDYNRVLFIVGQANMALDFTNPLRTAMRYQMAKYEDGTYGIR